MVARCQWSPRPYCAPAGTYHTWQQTWHFCGAHLRVTLGRTTLSRPRDSGFRRLSGRMGMEAAALGSCCELCKASSLVSRIRGTSFCRGMLLCGGVFRPPSVKGVPDVSSKATHCAGTVISPAPKSAKSDEPRTGDLPDETGLG